MSEARPARPTIYDVAQRAQVSKSLVSLVLNGSDQVSEARRAAVLEAIDALGYRRSRSAASLARSRTHTVGLVVDDFENPWFVPLLRGLREVLAPRGLHVAIREQQAAVAAGGNAVDEFLDSEVDALVVAAEPGREFDDPGVPTVLESTRLHGIAGADRVGSDQQGGARLAVEHLADLGHEHIGFVTGHGGSAAARYEGYVAAMRSRGLTPVVAGQEVDTTDEGGYLGTTELLRAHPATTAIFTANDTMALGACAALRETGHALPGEVALVGYDNSAAARSRLLDLTTVEPHNHEVGRCAGEALLRRLEDPDAPILVRTVPPELMVRTSTRIHRIPRLS